MTKLHMVGLPHTKISNEYSHCAFTGKIFRFPKMMQPLGYHIIEYSPEGSESDAKTKVPVLTNQEFVSLCKLYQEEHPGTVARMDSTLFKVYNEKLVDKMRPYVKEHDIICHPFGYATRHLAEAFPEAYHVETGIGYNDSWAPYRIFESYSWWHYHQGKERRYGHNYEFVIPNYYDISEWTIQEQEGKYLLYFGRIQEDKGLSIVKEIAKQTGMKTIICGKGDPTPYLDESIPNLIYEPPISGLARDALLGNAYAMLMPTIYTEPFGGAGVEGMLCGTPLISSDHGAFSETVTNENLRCKTLRNWLDAIALVKDYNRRALAIKARGKYNIRSVAYKYDDAFQQILQLKDKGWYTL